MVSPIPSSPEPIDYQEEPTSPQQKQSSLISGLFQWASSLFFDPSPPPSPVFLNRAIISLTSQVKELTASPISIVQYLWDNELAEPGDEISPEVLFSRQQGLGILSTPDLDTRKDSPEIGPILEIREMAPPSQKLLSEVTDARWYFTKTRDEMIDHLSQQDEDCFSVIKDGNQNSYRIMQRVGDRLREIPFTISGDVISRQDHEDSLCLEAIFIFEDISPMEAVDSLPVEFEQKPQKFPPQVVRPELTQRETSLHKSDPPHRLSLEQTPQSP